MSFPIHFYRLSFCILPFCTMYASAILATFCLVFLPLSIFAAPAAAPSPLYIVAAGSVTPFDVTGEGVTKDYSFTIHGVNPGNVDIVCQGHGTVRSPELRFAAKLNCPADPNENVFVEFGNDLNVKLSVAW